MKVALKKIVELQAGVYLKPTTVKTGVFLLGIKDFDEELNLIAPSMQVELKPGKEKFIVEEQHVLFSSRLKFHAYELPKSKELFLASNSFILLKPNVSRVYPGYLRWFLNHPNTQKQLEPLIQATSRVPYISQEELGNLKIDLPDIYTQMEIAGFHDLFKKEKSLTKQLLVKKEEYLQNLLFKYCKK